MALIVQLTGLPGVGKSFSLKSLNPKETYIIDSDKKGMTFCGWRADYSTTNKNYVRESNIDKIKSIIVGVAKTRPDIRVIVIDTLQTILTDFLQEEKKKAGFDMWKSLADDAYSLYAFANSVERAGTDDLIIVFICHAEEYRSVNPNTGIEEFHFRTLFPGKQATKNRLSKFTTYNLFCFVDAEEAEQEKKYKFKTQTSGFCESRSVYGVLPLVMPNDLGEVIKLIREKDLMIPTSLISIT